MVDCSLFTVDLDENPQYAALSYSWKRDEHWTPSVTDVFRAALASAKEKFWDRPKLKYGWSEFDIGKDESFGLYLMLEKERESEHMKTIMCDGKRMEVYPNLYEALLQLRQSHPGDYWIDAICINQVSHNYQKAFFKSKILQRGLPHNQEACLYLRLAVPWAKKAYVTNHEEAFRQLANEN